MKLKSGMYIMVAVLLMGFIWTSYQVKRSEMTTSKMTQMKFEKVMRHEHH